jgi:hypothetical protein
MAKKEIWWTEGQAQMVESWLCKHETLSWNSSPTKKIIIHINSIACVCVCVCVCNFGGTRVSTQGLLFARQVPHHIHEQKLQSSWLVYS